MSPRVYPDPTLTGDNYSDHRAIVRAMSANSDCNRARNRRAAWTYGVAVLGLGLLATAIVCNRQRRNASTHQEAVVAH